MVLYVKHVDIHVMANSAYLDMKDSLTAKIMTNFTNTASACCSWIHQYMAFALFNTLGTVLHLFLEVTAHVALSALVHVLRLPTDNTGIIHTPSPVLANHLTYFECYSLRSVCTCQRLIDNLDRTGLPVASTFSMYVAVLMVDRVGHSYTGEFSSKVTNQMKPTDNAESYAAMATSEQRRTLCVKSNLRALTKLVLLR